MDTLVGGANEAEVFMYVVKARKGNLDRMNYDSYKDKMENRQQEQDDYRVERDKEGTVRVGRGWYTSLGCQPLPSCYYDCGIVQWQ